MPTISLGATADIKRRYDIPTSNFLGHSDIAPERKTDPSGTFLGKRLANAASAYRAILPRVELPSSFDTAEALQALGYDVSNTEAAIRTFKFHFAGDDSSSQLDDDERRVLYCLLRRKENLQKAE